MKTAGIMQVRNYRHPCAVFDFLKRVTDMVIVLDDRSSPPFPCAKHCDVYLRRESNLPSWDPTTNLTTLMYQAFTLGAEYLVRLDDDMVFGAGLQTREDLAGIVENMRIHSVDFGKFDLRDFWETPDQYRVDGVWGTKGFAAVVHNWFFDFGITVRRGEFHEFHHFPFPSLRTPVLKWYKPKLYHAGCMSLDDRKARVAKYFREDPTNKWQPDYTYMLKDEGILLRSVPDEDFACFPLALQLFAKRS